MGIEDTYKRFEAWLQGWPGAFLSLALIVAAVVIVVIALRGSAIEKAIALTYVVFP